MFPAASGLIFEHRKAPPPIRKQGFGSAAHRHGGVIAKEIAYAPSKLRMLSRYQPPDIRAYQAHSWTWAYKFLGSGNSHKQQQVRAGIPVSGCVAGEIELASAQSRTPCGFRTPRRSLRRKQSGLCTSRVYRNRDVTPIFVPNLIPVTLGLLATLLRRQLHFAFSLSSG